MHKMDIPYVVFCATLIPELADCCLCGFKRVTWVFCRCAQLLCSTNLWKKPYIKVIATALSGWTVYLEKDGKNGFLHGFVLKFYSCHDVLFLVFFKKSLFS